MGTGMTLWEEILWIWIVLTILPKLVIIPIFRWLLSAIEDTKRQDAIDALWLASLEGGGGRDDDSRRRRRRPRPPSPRPGPHVGGGTCARIRPRPPRRPDVRARLLGRSAYAR